MREEPWRILMTVDPLGGVWTYALGLARGLAPHGYRFALVSMGGPLRPDQRQAAEAIGGLELFESEFRLEWMDDPWRDVEAAGEWLLDLERAWQPDLVHLNGYVHAALPWNVPVLVVAHSCVSSWWTAVRREPLPSCYVEYATRVRNGLRAVDHVVAPTRAMIAACQEHHGAVARWSVIANGLDPLPPADGSRQLKESCILGVGRLWDAAKNMAALAHAAAGLAWPVRLAGETRNPDGSTASFPGVELLGQLAKPYLEREYERAAIFALPARYEPFGLCALEAAQHGCALVLGDIPSLREIWEGAAWLVDPEDPNALRAALAHLIADPGHRVALGAVARERAARFTAERMIESYDELYSTLMRDSARARPVAQFS